MFRCFVRMTGDSEAVFLIIFPNSLVHHVFTDTECLMYQTVIFLKLNDCYCEWKWILNNHETSTSSVWPQILIHHHSSNTLPCNTWRIVFYAATILCTLLLLSHHSKQRYLILWLIVYFTFLSPRSSVHLIYFDHKKTYTTTNL